MIDIPSRKIRIHWNKRTVQHIGKHGDLEIRQVVDAVKGKHVLIKIGGSRFKIICEYCGRVLNVIVRRIAPNEFLLITAFDADDNDKKLYRQKAQW